LRITRLLMYEGTEKDVLLWRRLPDGMNKFPRGTIRIITLRQGWFCRLRCIGRALISA
jgi:hypothetical protein